ncbi:hypothetical protein PVNG_04737 [Plasmodium vivax North Korean]|uniref:Variable surface protein n=1 Tax=Plasmodium vivax North Korean TaxID=1035514 RepID=A0A0J9U0D4_PLAVI|nr:hypothetical protein PVNG_04737 [Plasmodium vivax North Korean]
MILLYKKIVNIEHQYINYNFKIHNDKKIYTIDIYLRKKRCIKKFPCDNALEIKFKIVNPLNKGFYRLLAKHELKNDLYKTQVRQNYADYGMNKNKKKDTGNKSTYSHVKKSGLNELDAYRKGYKQRYSKKKGLAKLDCYCEKKVFDKFDYINNLSVKINNSKISFIKKLFNKYVIRFIILSLIPFLGLIIPTLFGGDKEENTIIPLCPRTCTKHDGTTGNAEHERKYTWSPFSKDEWNFISYLNIILSYLFVIMIILLIIYTHVKFIKYEKIKSGKKK